MAAKYHLSGLRKQTVTLPQQQAEPARKIEINEVKKLHNRMLNCLRKRGISYHLAAEYNREIWYSVDYRRYFGIGFGNDQNGYEVRTVCSKICLHPQAGTTFKNGSNIVCFFEDFLTS